MTRVIRAFVVERYNTLIYRSNPVVLGQVTGYGN
jgi:hypothetical protein